MNIYFFTLFITILIGITFSLDRQNGKIIVFSNKTFNNKKVYCVLFAIIIILLIGLRSPLVGVDTYGYYNSYQNDNSSFTEFISNYLNYLNGGIKKFFSEKNSSFFHFYFSFFNHLGFSFNSCLLTLALLYVIPVFYLIYKDSSNSWKSCFWYLVFPFSLALSGIRISMAIGLSSVAYLYLKKNRTTLSVILYILAVIIHLSAVSFVMIYIIDKIKLNKNHIYVLIPAFVVLPFIGRIITPIMLSFTYYNDFGSIPWNLSIYVFFSVTTLLLIWFSSDKNEDYNKLMVIGTVICGLINYGAFGNMHRYFTQYICICLPGLFDSINDKTKRIIIELSYFIVGIYLFTKIFSNSGSFVPYKFFWQQ